MTPPLIQRVSPFTRRNLHWAVCRAAATAAAAAAAGGSGGGAGGINASDQLLLLLLPAGLNVLRWSDVQVIVLHQLQCPRHQQQQGANGTAIAAAAGQLDHHCVVASSHD
jgi:hypothetical protein